MYDFRRNAIEAPEIDDFVDLMNVMDVELENGQGSLRDLLVFDGDPVVFVCIY